MSVTNISDLKIIITGGSRGIGAATARLLAEGGAKIAIADIIDDEGRALAQALGDNVIYLSLDVTDEQGWDNAVAKTEETFGAVNALFNNAGILGFGAVDQCDLKDFQRVIDVNVNSVFLGIRATAPALRRAGGGVIINNSSTAGMQGYAGLAAYVSSKWAVRGLTKATALDLAPDNIRVLSLHPGPIRTPMTAELSDDVAASQPIARFGEAEEVARMVRFMLTEASYSTGSEFVVDGGALTGQVLPFPE
ncbi:MAG: SDR family oxidoreductase [Micavibrio sp.]|nr:MAG: SDR family oxidoreductase [Micavibrio sp.]